MAEDLDTDVRQAAKAAAAAAAVGAAVGVARSLAARAEDAAQRQRDGAGAEAEIAEPEAEDVGDTAAPRVEPPPAEPVQETEPEPELRKGVDARSVRRVADRAREFLQELSGADVESVSGLDRTPSGWAVTVEAVEVRRIPESTDVLATYEVELDDDGDLVRYERLRRYARAQSDRGDA
jgi:gas vesicle protein GvpO